ncbi:unnamed protein product [Owenia fusiformis]|uniref:Uncharacterized protein n=1 Tax=Owenia fusiformis TaxID=6347 RepID=A0A8J1Y625_OWEFU|nr:unnamed protein product [Owenia fusiformis]
MNTVLRSAARRAATRVGRPKRRTYAPYTGNRKLNTTEMEHPVETSIRKKLIENFQPVHLDVINESFMHSVPKGSESHFKVIVVSNKFDKVPLIKRHRLVNDVLKEELQSSIHALSIFAKTPAQWSTSQTVSKSPPCQGGAGL